MKRQLFVFLVALALTGILSLVYQLRAVADLSSLYRVPADAMSTRLVLTPVNADTLAGPDERELRLHLLQAQQSISRRLDMLSITGAHEVVVRKGYLEVSLPDHENTPYLINVITSVGEIDFIDGGQSAPPLGERIQIGPRTRPNRHIYQSLFTGKEVTAATPPDSSEGDIFYRLVLSPAASERFAEFTQAQPGSYVCMVVDERVTNCSRMYHQTGSTVEILPDLGSGTVMSLADLALFLESGPLPAPLSVARN